MALYKLAYIIIIIIIKVMQPSLNPTATRIASSEKRRPIAVSDCAFNQSPAGGASSERRRPIAVSDCAFNQSPACGASTAFNLALLAGVSQLVCRSS